MNSLFQRRRSMMEGEKPLTNPELRYTQNEYIIDNAGSTTEYMGAGITDYLPCTGGDKIVYFNPVSSLPIVSEGRLGKLIVYNENKVRIDYWNCRANGTEGSFTVAGSGNRFVRLNIDIENIAGSYAYNETTGQVYYAGKDTQYYGKTNINS